MTANDMKYAAQIIFESIDSANAPSFIDAEWAEILTAAQNAVVLDIIKGGLSDNEPARVALQPLIKNGSNSAVVVTTAANTVHANAWNFTLVPATNDVWIALDFGVDTTTPSATNVPLRPITFDYYRKNINNPFRKPDGDEEFWGLYETGDKITVITDGATPTKLRMLYLESLDGHPITPDVAAQENCVLHSSIHRDIVAKAGALAHLYVGDPQGFQLQTTENKNPGMFYLFK